MGSYTLTRPAFRSAASPLMRGRHEHTQDVTETATWVELNFGSVPSIDGMILNVDATVDMRIAVSANIVSGPVQGYRIPAGQSLPLALEGGDRVFVRTA